MTDFKSVRENLEREIYLAEEVEAQYAEKVPVDLLKDTLDLLKNQDEALKHLRILLNMHNGSEKPHVMTLEELQAIETPWNRNTPPYLFVEERSATRSRWMSWGFMHDCVRLPGTMGVQIYGSKWRVWNLQPKPEQMRDTPWEEPDV